MQEILLLESTLKEAKRWQIMSVILAMFILLLITIIIIILPLKQTEIRYVEFSNSAKHSFKVIPTPLGKKQKLLLTRQTLRDYVKNRIFYSGNNDIDTVPVKKVAAMSSKEVISGYRAIYERIHAETTIEKREVEIISDIPVSRNIHQVEYKTIDHHLGKTYENIWVATIAYKFEKQVVWEENELLNPLGIVVTGFNEAKKKLSDAELNEIFQ